MAHEGSQDLSWTRPENIRLATFLFGAPAVGLFIWGAAAYVFQNHNVLPMSAAVSVGGSFLILILVIRRTGVTLQDGILHADGIGGKRAVEIAAAPRIKMRVEQQSGRLELSVYPAKGPAARVSILDARRCQPPVNLIALSAALLNCRAPHAAELATALALQAESGSGVAPGRAGSTGKHLGNAVTVAALLNLIQLLP